MALGKSSSLGTLEVDEEDMTEKSSPDDFNARSPRGRGEKFQFGCKFIS